VDDLVQEAYLKLCSDNASVLRGFRPTHKSAIFGFIKVFTANLAYDYFKASHSQKRGGAVAASSIDDENVSRILPAPKKDVDALNREVLIQEIGSCLESFNSGPNAGRDRRVFWLYYRTGLSASAIAALPSIGLTTKGVESTLLRLTRQIRERLASAKLTEGADRTGEGILPAESL